MKIAFPFHKVQASLIFDEKVLQMTILRISRKISLEVLKLAEEIALENPHIYNEMRIQAEKVVRDSSLKNVNIIRLNLMVPAAKTKLSGMIVMERINTGLPIKTDAVELRRLHKEIITQLRSHVKSSSRAGQRGTVRAGYLSDR